MPISDPAAPSASEVFVRDILGEPPKPIRAFVETALQLKELNDLYAHARALGHPAGLSSGVLESLGVSVRSSAADLERIPQAGPAVLVANHPFGFLDGLMIDSVLQARRADFRIVANTLLCGIPEIAGRIIPVEILRRSPGVVQANARALRSALRWLADGHLLVIFPAGEVAHWQPREGRVMDPAWNQLAARLVRASQVPAAPVYFAGSNSMAFQLAGLVHPSLRTASLPRELMNKRGKSFELRVGSPLAWAELAPRGDDEAVTRYLRARTYLLAHRMPRIAAPRADSQPPLAPADARTPLIAEIAALRPLIETRDYAVYLEQGTRIPALLDEIGRLREQTFRAAGEGTGKSRDLDRFDSSYWHLTLWSRQREQVAGAYRLAWTEEVLSRYGIRGLYTSTLFRYHPRFFDRIGPAVELGRSFVVPECQREFAPLLLLWQGLAQCVARRPGAPVLFGPVSISNDYCAAARELIVRYLRRHCSCRDLAGLVTPRRGFRSHLARFEELRTIGELLDDVDGLSRPMRDLDQQSGVPVLLRQYLKLGGRVVAFNVDPAFSDALDCLLFVDLRAANPKTLEKYMGPGGAAAFLNDAPPLNPRSASAGSLVPPAH
jgi:putative hemolysin